MPLGCKKQNKEGLHKSASLAIPNIFTLLLTLQQYEYSMIWFSAGTKSRQAFVEEIGGVDLNHMISMIETICFED